MHLHRVSHRSVSAALTAVVITLFLTIPAKAEEPGAVSQAVSGETKHFLADPARSGSLVGTIVAGAAVAHPLAPIVGSVAGFFIGKSTDYTEQGTAKGGAYAQRSLIPSDNSQVTKLGLSGKPTSGELSTSEAGVSAKGEAGTSQNPYLQRIAAVCSEIDRSKSLPRMCYYYAE